MAIEPYQVKAAIKLYEWVKEDPERAADTGVKLIGFGAAILLLAALFSK
jgi:hypothetical protein